MAIYGKSLAPVSW